MALESWMYRDQYEFRVLDDFKSELQFQALVDLLLTNPPSVDPLYSAEEKQHRDRLQATSHSLVNFRLAVYSGSQLVAFTRAMQTDGANLHMALSAVHPDHQRKGIYTELVRAVLAFAKEQGFQTIDSSHRATNNPVIIAKLRAGFVINGLTLSDVMGCLVKLTYFHNPTRRKLIDARAGLSRPEGELRDLFF
ncbi:MAG: GNAT family N-acetyltransferase [Cryobacterium sp.]|nr:GNAT family N-acetyltransferase [Oligoflexia bacterium]